jgi:hypothetical protein
MLAAGYNDGTLLLVRISDGAEILVREPDGNPVVALSWNARGDLLGFACEKGAAGIVSVA